MVRAGAHDVAQDYVVATGVARSVRDFVAAAFARAGIEDWADLVEVDPALVRPADPTDQCGDASRARTVLGWQPTVTFEEQDGKTLLVMSELYPSKQALDMAIEGRHVLIVEDIVDSGLTLQYLMRSLETRPRVAIAHDYLTQRGGAERVVLALHRAFPDATIHTTLYDPDGTYPEFRDARIETSPLNKVGRLRRSHRAALPFLAPASSWLRIDADVVDAGDAFGQWQFGNGHETSLLAYRPNRHARRVPRRPAVHLGQGAGAHRHAAVPAALGPSRGRPRGPLPLQLARCARADCRGLRDHRRGGPGPGRHRHLG